MSGLEVGKTSKCSLATMFSLPKDPGYTLCPLALDYSILNPTQNGKYGVLIFLFCYGKWRNWHMRCTGECVRA